MPRKYDRDNKGTPSSRTRAPAVRGRAHRRPADFAALPVLRREAVAIILSPEVVFPAKSSDFLGFCFEFAWILLGFPLISLSESRLFKGLSRPPRQEN